MSVIEIDYDNLLESSNKAKKLSDELDVYASRITKRVSNPVSGLPGNDNKGYASSILSSASAKIKELNNRSQMFNTYYQNVETFVNEAKDADTRVKNSIKTTAKNYIGKRSIWQAAGDWLYNNLYVGLLNKSDFVRGIKDFCKKGWNYVTHFTENARDWFKHGEGKFWWNIVSAITSSVLAVVGAISAVATAVAAVVAAIAGGPILAAVLAVVAGLAAVVGGIITLLNSGVKIYNNGKAVAKQKEDPYSARYVGNIGSLSDAVEKYDLGDAEANENWKTTGKIIDTTEVACGTIGILYDFSNLGAVKDVRTGNVAGYKFNKSNIKYNIKKSMGFNFDNNSWDFKKMFDFGTGKTKGFYQNENGFGGLNFFNNLPNGVQKGINILSDASGVTSTTMKVMEKGDSIYESFKNGLNFSSPADTKQSLATVGYTVMDTSSMLSVFKPIKKVDSMVFKPIKNVLSWEKIILEH